MIRGMRRLTSLNNLLRAGCQKGQVATLLIMLTVVLLIFVMVTMNLGETSLMSTRIANAADAATLSLASQLSTKSRQLAEGLKNSGAKDTSYTKACSPSGAAAIVCAIVLVIIAIVILVCSWGSGAPASAKLIILAVSIVAGAAGGAIGGEIAGTGAGQGAIQGAIVGAAIATIYIGAGCPGLETSSASGVSAGTVGMGDELVFAEGGQIATSSGTMSVAPGTTLTGLGQGAVSSSIPMTFAASGGAVFQGALSLASSGYSQSVQDKMAEKQIDLFTAMMKNMNEKDRIRESSFMTALSQIVDDPNMSADLPDTNFNKDDAELVPNFQIWVFNRLHYLGTLVGDSVTPINIFFDRTRHLPNEFSLWIDGEDQWQEIEGGTYYTHNPGYLETQEYRYATVCDEKEGFFGETFQVNCHKEMVNNAGNDGNIVTLLRGLEAAGYDLSFWEPGPTLAQMKEAAENCGEDTCEGPVGFDQVDALREEVREAGAWLTELDTMDITERAQTWGGWLDVFIDLDDNMNAPESIYFTFEKYRALMFGWSNEVLAIVRSLPKCQPDPKEPGSVLVFPCKYSDEGFPDSCTVTKEKKDASLNFYVGLVNAINTLGKSVGLNSHIRDLYNAIYNISSGTGLTMSELGGLNPAMYQWDDARGHHVVKVGTGNFKLARLKKTRYGNWFKGKKCMELRNYNDNGANCWVRIERTDAKHDFGVLGFWNPFAKGVSKISRAAYSYDYLKLVSTAE